MRLRTKNQMPNHLHATNRQFLTVGAAISPTVPQLDDVFPKESVYHVAKAQLVNSEPFGNSDAYLLQAPSRHFRILGGSIPLRAPKLPDVFPKYGFYPLLKTQLVNPASCENPDACLLDAPNRHFRKVGPAISIMVPQLPDLFPKRISILFVAQIG